MLNRILNYIRLLSWFSLDSNIASSQACALFPQKQMLLESLKRTLKKFCVPRSKVIARVRKRKAWKDSCSKFKEYNTKICLLPMHFLRGFVNSTKCLIANNLFQISWRNFVASYLLPKHFKNILKFSDIVLHWLA